MFPDSDTVCPTVYPFSPQLDHNMTSCPFFFLYTDGPSVKYTSPSIPNSTFANGIGFAHSASSAEKSVVISDFIFKRSEDNSAMHISPFFTSSKECENIRNTLSPSIYNVPSIQFQVVGVIADSVIISNLPSGLSDFRI